MHNPSAKDQQRLADNNRSVEDLFDSYIRDSDTFMNSHPDTLEVWKTATPDIRRIK